MDMGHGIAVAIAQMVAEELDVPFASVKIFMGDTATSVNQGGASGSTGIEDGGKQMRLAAAEARRVLVEMAADKLGVPSDQLEVTDAVVHVKADPSKKVSYAELVGGRYFNVPLAWNGKIGNPLLAPGKAKPKDPKNYRVVGQPIKREDVAPRVFAQLDFVTDVKVPGMVHGRMIRPPVAGAVPVKVDETLDQGHSGRQGGVEPGLPRRRRRQGMGRHQGDAPAQSGMVGRQAAVPGEDVGDLRLHPQLAGTQK